MQHDKNSLGTTTTLERPLLGRIIGWNALLAALVAATVIAASMIQLRSGQPLSAGAAPEIAGAADEAAAAAMPLPAVAPAQASGAGVMEVVSDTAEFEVGDTRTLSVSGFDSSKGELNSVVVTTSISFTSTGTVTNNGVVPFIYETFPGRLFVAEISGPAVNGVTVDKFSPLFTAVEIPAGVTKDVSVGSEDATGTDNPPIAQYIGGTIEFPATSAGKIAEEKGPNSESMIASTVTASVTVTYLYTPPPPPPVSSTITISKTVNAGPGATVPIFNFTVTCETGFNTSVGVTADGSDVVVALDGVADGTPCTVTETVDETRWSTEVNGYCGSSVNIVAGQEANFVNTLRAGSETPLGACA